MPSKLATVIPETIPATAAVTFPRWQANSANSLIELSKGQTLMKVAENSFNYNVLGVSGFKALADMIECSKCFSYSYELLDDAVTAMEELVQNG